MERILVVDDEIHIGRILKKYLSAQSYDVYTAADGLEAIDRVKEVKPHVVLLDIIMPGMGGIETLKEIKKINPKIVVIMITAVIDEELAKRALQLGADFYITKPFELDYLETCVRAKIIELLN